MKLPILLLLCFLAISVAAGGKNWALLFTGAWGYYNYSTHSNLCHAYQVLHKAGIPDERIVVIMYNDVANDTRNPFPGQLFNNYDHIDVLKGTPLDYTGKEISAELILSVLQGDKESVQRLIGRVGKVIESGPEDNIFVAVSDHGGDGVLLMPGKDMTVRQLHEALRNMYEAKKYAKLVFYLESCLSGSMFEDLPKDMNIYALTASKPQQSAAMNYCDDPAFSKPRSVCIGGQFSTAWIENTEQINVETFTFQQQSEAVKKGVNFSQPQLYGDLSITGLPMKQFFSGEHSQPISDNVLKFTPVGQIQARPETSKDAIQFHTMRLSLLQRQAKKNPSDMRIRVELERVQALMVGVDSFFYQVAKNVYPAGVSSRRVASITSSAAEKIRNWDCYEAALEAIRTSCPGLRNNEEVQGYFMSKYSVLVKLCNRKTGPEVSSAVRNVAKATSLC